MFTLTLACLTLPALSNGQDSKSQPSDEILRDSKSADFNRDIYYRHKLEFSFETGCLPINTPFVFDVFASNDYGRFPYLPNYTLVPAMPSLRMHLGKLGGRWFLRGNTDLSFSPAFIAIPKGPETRYVAFVVRARRNFVQRNWRIAPYFELGGGAGFIDAKGPKGVRFAQGQDFTFNIMLGSGFRYNFNSRYSISAGVSYMHISNALLSQPKFEDFGINVYGPMVGVNIRLGKHPPQSAQKGQR
jgi:Lipid A 3-O-deacylase (PagL)